MKNESEKNNIISDLMLIPIHRIFSFITYIKPKAAKKVSFNVFVCTLCYALKCTGNWNYETMSIDIWNKTSKEKRNHQQWGEPKRNNMFDVFPSVHVDGVVGGWLLAPNFQQNVNVVVSFFFIIMITVSFFTQLACVCH